MNYAAPISGAAGRLAVARGSDPGVPLAAIVGVSLEYEMPVPERRLMGFSAGGVRCGRFRLEGLGDGVMYTRVGSPPYLVVRTPDSFLIINHDDAEQTRAAALRRMKPDGPTGNASASGCT